MPLQKVIATEDNDGHWYVIPVDKVDLFREMDEAGEAGEADEWESFMAVFGKYLTGGDLNLVQLWAEIN